MGRPRILKNPRTIPVQVESDVYDQIMKLLPRDASFADKVREWMLKELESINMEKNGQPKSDPLNLIRQQLVTESGNDKRTFDLFEVSVKDCIDYVWKLVKEGDWETLDMLTPKTAEFQYQSTLAKREKRGWTLEKEQIAKNVRDRNEPREFRVPYMQD